MDPLFWSNQLARSVFSDMKGRPRYRGGKWAGTVMMMMMVMIIKTLNPLIILKNISQCAGSSLSNEKRCCSYIYNIFGFGIEENI